MVSLKIFTVSDFYYNTEMLGFPGDTVVKNLPAKCRRCKRCGFYP